MIIRNEIIKESNLHNYFRGNYSKGYALLYVSNPTLAMFTSNISLLSRQYSTHLLFSKYSHLFYKLKFVLINPTRVF